MKKALLFLTGIFLSGMLVAQDKYALTNVNHKIGFSMLELFDEYLSPLTYSGFGIKYENEKRKFWNPESPNLSRNHYFDLTIGITENPPGTSNILYVGGNYAWGLHYHFRPVRNLQLLAGGLWNVGLGLKYNMRNVNNPYNMDVAMNLNASVMAVYDLSLFHNKLPVRLQAAFGTPFMGMMFTPELGESYFEMFELGSDSQLVNFSSFHNKQALKQQYSIQFTLRKSVLSINYTNNYLKYTGNDIVFKTKENVFSIGWTYNMRIFAGKRNAAPDNFIGF